MSLPIEIQDGIGTSYRAQVTKEHALKVTQVSSRGIDNVEELKRYKIWKEFYLYGSANDMNVDGSVSPITFKIEPNTEWIKYITSTKIILTAIEGDIAAQDFKKFSKSYTAGLTNGLEFFIQQDGVQIDVFAEPVQKIGDFLKYMDWHTTYGNAVTSQIDYFDASVSFPTPVPLIPSSTDFAGITINDDLSVVNIDTFFAIATGYYEIVE